MNAAQVVLVLASLLAASSWLAPGVQAEPSETDGRLINKTFHLPVGAYHAGSNLSSRLLIAEQPGATFISVALSDISLPPSSILEITSESGDLLLQVGWDDPVYSPIHGTTMAAGSRVYARLRVNTSLTPLPSATGTFTLLSVAFLPTDNRDDRRTTAARCPDDREVGRCVAGPIGEAARRVLSLQLRFADGTLNTCTGFLLSRSGYVSTNYHCVKSLTDLIDATVTANREHSACGSAEPAPEYVVVGGTLVATQPQLDTAILRFVSPLPSTFGCLNLRPSPPVYGERAAIPQHFGIPVAPKHISQQVLGTRCIVVDTQFTRPDSPTGGRVSPASHLSTNCQATEGASGSPVIDDTGLVVGTADSGGDVCSFTSAAQTDFLRGFLAEVVPPESCRAGCVSPAISRVRSLLLPGHALVNPSYIKSFDWLGDTFSLTDGYAWQRLDKTATVLGSEYISSFFDATPTCPTATFPGVNTRGDIDSGGQDFIAVGTATCLYGCTHEGGPCSYSSSILSRRIRRDGTPAADQLQLSAMPDTQTGDVRVAMGQTGGLIAFTAFPAPNQQENGYIYVAPITKSGQLAQAPTAVLPYRDIVDVIWNGRQFALYSIANTYLEPPNQATNSVLFLSLFDNAGVLLGDWLLRTGNSPDIGAGVGASLPVWSGDFFATVSTTQRAGGVFDKELLLFDPVDRSLRSAPLNVPGSITSLAWDGSEFLAVVGNFQDASLLRLSRGGSLLSTEAITGSGSSVAALAVGPDGIVGVRYNEAFTLRCCSDADLDGQSECDSMTPDCDDTDPQTFYGAAEACDGLNNNCASPLWPAPPAAEVDNDRDGWRICGSTPDCDDTNVRITPFSPEYCDGLANNCQDPTWPALRPQEQDRDQDGYLECSKFEASSLNPPGVLGGDDCNDDDASVHKGAIERNDGKDNQCPRDSGYGLVDEIEGAVAFPGASNTTTISWSAQPDATSYQVRRSLDPSFSQPCACITTSQTSWADTSVPTPGTAFFYLIRSSAPFPGSWGASSAGVERTGACLQLPCAM